MKTIKAMLFDLDGTLLDSAPDLVGSLNWLRSKENMDPLPVDEMSRYVSQGAVGLLKAGMPGVDTKQFESWRLMFLEHYSKNSCRDSKLYDGIPELLKLLDSNGIPWGVVTNKIESFTFPIIEALGLRDNISCVVCGDTLEVSKPDPGPVIYACAALDVAPDETLFVGDDIRDIQAGYAAGTQTAAVHYGYGSEGLTGELVLQSLQVHHPSDLLELVKPNQQAGA